MKTRPAPEAKADISEPLNACEREGAQFLTRRGEETALSRPVEDWGRMSRSQPGLQRLLLAPQGRYDNLPLPRRGRGKHRAYPDF